MRISWVNQIRRTIVVTFAWIIDGSSTGNRVPLRAIVAMTATSSAAGFFFKLFDLFFMRFTSILIQESSNTKVIITYMAAGSECVRVIVRCRPMNARENQLTSKVIFFSFITCPCIYHGVAWLLTWHATQFTLFIAHFADDRMSINEI